MLHFPQYGHQTLVRHHRHTFEVVALNIHSLQRKYKDAAKCYQNAMSIDETSIPSLIGLLRCQVIEYEAAKRNDSAILNDIKDQIEFLEQVQVGPVRRHVIVSALQYCKSGLGTILLEVERQFLYLHAPF